MDDQAEESGDSTKNRLSSQKRTCEYNLPSVAPSCKRMCMQLKKTCVSGDDVSHPMEQEHCPGFSSSFENDVDLKVKPKDCSSGKGDEDILELPSLLKDDTSTIPRSSKCNSESSPAHKDHGMEDQSTPVQNGTDFNQLHGVSSKMLCGSLYMDNCEETQDSTSNFRTQINSLPHSLLLKVFKILPISDLLCKAALVCHLWYDLAHNADLWRHFSVKSHAKKVTDSVLIKMTGYSNNVSLVDLTDSKQLTTQGVSQMTKQCPNLRTLKLSCCQQLKQEAFVSVAENCVRLQELHLDCCSSCSDMALQQIAVHCKELHTLKLGQCSRITDIGIIAVARNCKNLRTLVMDQCSKVTAASLEELTENCTELDMLSCMGCNIGSDGLHNITKLKKLTHLEIAQVSGTTDDSVCAIAEACPLIETLNLSLCPRVTDHCIATVATRAKNLHSLYVVSCKLTDQALIQLGLHSKKLATLDAGWCENITDEGATKISKLSKSLRYLGLMRCDKVCIPTMDYLVAEYPHITYSTMWLDCKQILEQARQAGYPTEIPQVLTPDSSVPAHLAHHHMQH